MYFLVAPLRSTVRRGVKEGGNLKTPLQVYYRSITDACGITQQVGDYYRTITDLLQPPPPPMAADGTPGPDDILTPFSRVTLEQYAALTEQPFPDVVAAVLRATLGCRFPAIMLAVFGENRKNLVSLEEGNRQDLRERGSLHQRSVEVP